MDMRVVDWDVWEVFGAMDTRTAVLKRLGGFRILILRVSSIIERLCRVQATREMTPLSKTKDVRKRGDFRLLFPFSFCPSGKGLCS